MEYEERCVKSGMNFSLKQTKQTHKMSRNEKTHIIIYLLHYYEQITPLIVFK